MSNVETEVNFLVNRISLNSKLYMQRPTASPMGGTGSSHSFSGRANLEAISQQSLQPWLKHSTPPSSYDRNKPSPKVSPLKMEDSLVSWLAIATDGCKDYMYMHNYYTE